MSKNKQERNPQLARDSKFLTRHHSYKDLPLFCCSSSIPNELETSVSYLKRTSNKLSMKTLTKKSTILQTNNPYQLSQSQWNGSSKRSINHSFYTNHMKKPSQLSSVNQSQRNQIATNFKKMGNNIKFSYKGRKIEQPKPIHNYHTTNFIVGKYIVQPQEMNIIVNNSGQQQSQNNYMRASQTLNTGRYFDLSHQFEQYQNNLDSPKWVNQQPSYPSSMANKIPQAKTQPYSNNCHFSFGKHQKHQFMSKYMKEGMREVESKRQSQNSNDCLKRESFQKEKVKIEDLRRAQEDDRIRGDLKIGKSSLLNLVREDDILYDSQQCSSCRSEQQSIVDYRRPVLKISQLSYHKQPYS